MNEKDLKIFIVDDEPEILKVLEKYLTKQGYTNVRSFTNPLTAINSYNGNNADIIFLDIMMPNMDGIEALNKFKEKNPDVKIIMITAHSTLDRVLKSHKVGADHYIMKPFKSLRDIEEKMLKVAKE